MVNNWKRNKVDRNWAFMCWRIASIPRKKIIITSFFSEREKKTRRLAAFAWSHKSSRVCLRHRFLLRNASVASSTHKIKFRQIFTGDVICCLATYGERLHKNACESFPELPAAALKLYNNRFCMWYNINKHQRFSFWRRKRQQKRRRKKTSTKFASDRSL